MVSEPPAPVGPLKRLAISFWPGLTPFVLLLVLATFCATVLYTRVYARFDRVRIQVVTAERASSQRSVVVPLPDLSDLFGFPTAIVLRLENSGLVDRTVTISVSDTELGRRVLRSGRTVRVDLSVSADAGWTSGDRLRIDGDGDGWSLHALELANIHGFSHGMFGFVITPSGTDRYD